MEEARTCIVHVCVGQVTRDGNETKLLRLSVIRL